MHHIKIDHDLAATAESFAECGGEAIRVSLDAFRALPNPSNFMDSLIDVLKTAKKVQSICFSWRQFLGSESLPSEKLDNFCHVVGNLPGLKELVVNCQIGYSGAYDEDPSLHYIARILREAKELQKLTFSNFSFGGSQENFEKFAAALVTSKIKHFVLDYRVYNSRATLANMNPVLSVLSIPQKITTSFNLHWLIPSAWELATAEFSTSTLSPLAKFLSHPHQSKELIVEENKLRLIAGVMKHHNICPKSLDVYSGTFNADDLQNLANIVAHNHHNLTKITVQLSCYHSRRPTAIARPTAILDHDIAPMIAALGNNSILKHLTLAFGRIFTISYKMLLAFAEVLETKNYTLSTLLFERRCSYMRRNTNPEDSAVLERIKFYTKLNWLGRSKLLTQDPNTLPREAWVDKLFRARKDVSCLFYFISINPFLCDSCGSYEVLVDNAAVATRTRRSKKPRLA